MTGTIVGVLRGGPSREHEVSLQTGAAMLTNLPSERYTVRDIYIDKQGNWHDRGRPVSPVQALQGIDVALIGLHGEYGEDGEVQKLLEQMSVPYVGSTSFPSFLSAHKVLTKEKALELGVLTPRYRFVEESGDVEKTVADAIRSFSQPVVVKPLRWGSSVGVSILSGYAPVLAAVSKLLSEGSGGVLIEERIKGREATMGVVENLRGEALYALPPIEIIPPTSEGFFSYDAKYSGETREICPGQFSRKVTEELSRVSRLMHEALGLRHYSRSDFIVSPKGDVYYLETNNAAAVGLGVESLLPKSLAAVGIALPEFLTHIIDSALVT
jgi:D-alanine-D-alanine ligase